MNLLKKQINIPNGWKEFFRPTWGKLIAPLIFLFLFFSLFIPFVNLFIFFIVALLCIPLYPIYEVLGLSTTGPMYLDLAPGPPLSMFFLAPFFWALASYLVGCLFSYIRVRKRL